jgi:hypothetical protein
VAFDSQHWWLPSSLVLALAFAVTTLAGADALAVENELQITAGGGPQDGSSQSHKSVGVDYSFFRHIRSRRQHLQIGASYTYIEADTDQHDTMHAISIYPQLSLYPTAEGRFAQLFPPWADPFFFVRALGPTYISTNQLGDREQANNFAFQAQVGVGLLLNYGSGRRGIVSLSWKHFSNANLFDDNDGIDLPVVLSIGLKL